MRRLLLFLMLMIPATGFAQLDISDAWIKNLPPSVPVRAGYMTIHNPQSRALSIVATSSKAFASVEIHETRMQDGMMRMDPVPRLKIEAGASVQLEPGGLHLMMMHPAEPTSVGQVIGITIELDDGSRQELQLTVRK